MSNIERHFSVGPLFSDLSTKEILLFFLPFLSLNDASGPICSKVCQCTVSYAMCIRDMEARTDKL
jgi:hypothetical protein